MMIKAIEDKLENGVQQFTATEVVTLLNEIRLLKSFIKRNGEKK